MKRIKTIAISISLSLIFSSLVIGLYAGNDYSPYSETDSYIGIQKVQLTGNKKQYLKLKPLDTPENFEQDYQIDSLMKNKKFNEESVKSSEIEDSMIIFEPIITPCSNNQSNFIEKSWMKKHSFMIL